MSTPGTPTARTSSGAIVATIALAAASALLFVLIWFTVHGAHHDLALATIGIISLVFALVSTISRAFTRGGAALKSLAWGYAGLGFALLIGSLVLAGSMSAIGVGLELAGLVIVVVLIAIVAFLGVWGAGSARMTQQREMRRAAWQASNPRSAFDYTTARPNVPASPTSASDESPPTAPPGASQ
jgi:MFS family permease